MISERVFERDQELYKMSTQSKKKKEWRKCRARDIQKEKKSEYAERRKVTARETE